MDHNPPVSDPALAAAALATPRLLVVDDLEDNRIIMSRRFGRRGFEVVEAAGGAEALELIARERFDLVLLDVVMPDVDGFEVLRRIRAEHSADELPVVMATVRDASADVVYALKIGANDYITKPIDFSVALARVEAQVSHKQAIAQARAQQPELAGLVEELRRQIVQAEAATRAKSEFLANMSHEIRTPLNGILGMAALLAERSAEPRERQMARTIVESAEALERLLSDALDLSRVEAGKLEIREETFDLARVVERSAELFRPAAAAKGLRYRVELAPEARASVQGDPLRLQQILTNLISNAVKFTAAGEVVCEVAASSEGFRFQVRDTGIGFDPARSEELFGRFEQADGSIVERFGGSGLGLAISRRLAELMGGRLSAASAPGEGATFTLELPLPAAVVAPSVPAEPADRRGRRARVLAAEDHVTNRRLLELMLDPADLDLVMVSDGAQALEAFGADQFDLVLMDVQMPVLDGLSAIRAIRRQEMETRRARTPVIALSAHAMSEHVERSLAAGADRHLTKPVRAPVLLAAVQELLAGSADATAEPVKASRG